MNGSSAANPRPIAYYRVSTKRQRRSGLGLEAQKEAVQRFAGSEGLGLIGEYIEAESGKGADALDRSPQLAAALAAARASRCPVTCGQARSIVARRGLCGRPDGPACAVHRGGVGHRCFM